jgi:hypothetical protein
MAINRFLNGKRQRPNSTNIKRLGDLRMRESSIKFPNGKASM